MWLFDSKDQSRRDRRREKTIRMMNVVEFGGIVGRFWVNSVALLWFGDEVDCWMGATKYLQQVDARLPEVTKLLCCPVPSPHQTLTELGPGQVRRKLAGWLLAGGLELSSPSLGGAKTGQSVHPPCLTCVYNTQATIEPQRHTCQDYQSEYRIS